MDLCPAGRAGTPDEVGTVGALLMGADGAFITGSDFLMDGGVTAAYCLANSLRAEGKTRHIAFQPKQPLLGTVNISTSGNNAIASSLYRRNNHGNADL